MTDCTPEPNLALAHLLTMQAVRNVTMLKRDAKRLKKSRCRFSEQNIRLVCVSRRWRFQEVSLHFHIFRLFQRN